MKIKPARKANYPGLNVRQRQHIATLTERLRYLQSPECARRELPAAAPYHKKEAEALMWALQCIDEEFYVFAP